MTAGRAAETEDEGVDVTSWRCPRDVRSSAIASNVVADNARDTARIPPHAGPAPCLDARWPRPRSGKHGIEPLLEGSESETALLSNASRCQRLFGYPSVSVEQMIEWIAGWIGMGGPTLNKPTHFETRDGRF